jgi:hypothetical protein
VAALSLRTSAAGGDTTGTSDRTCTITPAVGDLFLVFSSVSVNSNNSPTCSDDNGGTYTRIRSIDFNAAGSHGSAFVRDQLLTNTTSTVVTVATGSNDSGNVVVFAVSGMERTGSAAVRQSARVIAQAAGGTPSVSFASAVLSKNFVCGMVGNGSNPATLTPPVALPERQDVGFGTPNIGLEACSVNSGITLTTITWAGTSATAFGAIVIELDSNPVDLTADVGAFTESGQAATFGVTMQAEVGAFGVSGQAATFGLTTPIAAGAIAEAGQVASFKFSAPEAAGAYLIDGQDATLTYTPAVSHTLDADVQTYSISGQVVDLLYSGDVPGVAQITVGPQTNIFAGITRLDLSGQDSYRFDGAPVPPDCAMTAALMFWSFGDGTFGAGFNISKVWSSSGVKTVTLLVKWADGTSSSTTRSVTVLTAPTFALFDKFVNFSTGSDGNPGTSALPYKTLQKGIDAWRSFRGSDGSIPSDPGRLSLNKGDSFTYAGLDGINFGPLYVCAYGAGAAPIITVATGKTWDVGNLVREDRVVNWVANDGLKIRWAAEDIGNIVTMSHQGSQLSSCTVENGGIFFTGAGSSIASVVQSKGWRYGVFPSSSYLHITLSTFTGNGHSGGGGAADHQIYASNGVDHSGFTSVTTDATGASAALDGFKFSGCSKLYVADCEAKNSQTAFDIGGNPGEETTDVVFDRPTSRDCLHQGFWPDFMQRVSIRNPRVFNALDGAALEVDPDGGDITDFELYGGSFSALTGIFMRVANSAFTGVVVENTAVTKTNAGAFYDISDSSRSSLADLAEIHLSNNRYYRTGGSSATFAIVNGTTLSFAQWQAAPYNMDAGSTFADPLFTSTSDLRLQAGSPCIDTGATIGVLAQDYAQVYRPIGAGYDIGAYERGGSGSPYSMNAEVGAFTVADTSGGSTPNTRFKIAMQAVGPALFGITGQSATLTDTSEGGSSGSSTMVAGTGAFSIQRFNANLIYSNQPGEDDGHTPVITVVTGPVTFIPMRLKNGKIIYRLGGQDERR